MRKLNPGGAKMFLNHRTLFVIIIACIFFVFVGGSSADTILRDIIAICGDEVKLFGEVSGLRLKWGTRYAAADWQIYQHKNSFILILIVRHNLFWYDYMPQDIKDTDKQRFSSALLYGKYVQGVGWVWYERSWLSGRIVLPEKLKEQLAFMENGKPLAILTAAKEPGRTTEIRYMCRKLIRDQIFVYPNHGSH